MVQPVQAQFDPRKIADEMRRHGLSDDQISYTINQLLLEQGGADPLINNSLALAGSSDPYSDIYSAMGGQPTEGASQGFDNVAQGDSGLNNMLSAMRGGGELPPQEPQGPGFFGRLGNTFMNLPQNALFQSGLGILAGRTPAQSFELSQMGAGRAAQFKYNQEEAKWRKEQRDAARDEAKAVRENAGAGLSTLDIDENGQMDALEEKRKVYLQLAKQSGNPKYLELADKILLSHPSLQTSKPTETLRHVEARYGKRPGDPGFNEAFDDFMAAKKNPYFDPRPDVDAWVYPNPETGRLDVNYFPPKLPTTRDEAIGIGGRYIGKGQRPEYKKLIRTGTDAYEAIQLYSDFLKEHGDEENDPDVFGLDPNTSKVAGSRAQVITQLKEMGNLGALTGARYGFA